MTKPQRRRFGFRARFVPGIASGDFGETRRIDALRQQDALWEAIQFNYSAMLENLAFEVRYVAHETTRQIDVWLAFEATTADETEWQSVMADIGRLLPKEFGWEPYSNLDSAERFVPNAPRNREWWTSRAVRRLVFADVPDVAEVDLVPQEDASNGKDQEGALPKVVDHVLDDMRDRVLVGLQDEPTQGAPDARSIWVMPLIMAINPQGQIGVTFFEQLQAAAPAAVSIRAARLSPRQLPLLRTVATHYMQQNFGRLSGTIESAYRGEANTYLRYLLPDDLFNVLDIGFASAQRETMDALYHNFNAQVGGLAVFHQADVRRRTSLESFGRDIAMSAYLQEFEQERREYLVDDLREFGIDDDLDDPAVERFLLDAPYIYTFHEVRAVLMLPLADERGMSGVDCRMVAPFHSPSLSHDPVKVSPSDGVAGSDGNEVGIRVGIRGRVRLLGNGATNERCEIREDEGPAHWHRIKSGDLTKHALVVGSTGSGKSLTTGFLLRELHRLGKPFCVVEPVKTEYYDKIASFDSNVQRFNFEGDCGGRPASSFFGFDPLRVPRGVTVARHASYLQASLQAAFPMDALGALLLEGGLVGYYRYVCRFDLLTRGERALYRVVKRKNGTGTIIHPSFEGFYEYFPGFISRAFAVSAENQKGNELRENAMQFFRRRFDILREGMLGQSIKLADQRARTRFHKKDMDWLSDDLDALFNANSVLELDAIPDNDDKALVMAFVLSGLYERRQAEKVSTGGGPVLKHVLVVEEAHRLLSASAATASRGEFGGIDPKAKAIGLFVDMLAEIRAFGQGIVIVEQIPTKIVSEAIKNTNLKIMLRLPSRQDREVLGQAMNLTEEQIRFVATLRASVESGVDFVAFEERLDQPILLNLPLPIGNVRTDWAFDEFFQS